MAAKSPPEDPALLSWATLDSGLLTETIELNGLSSNQLTESGSFDLRGFRLSSLGRLLNALPTPALLIDCNFAIIFANEASQKLGYVPEKLQSLPFLSLFPRFKDAANFQRILDQVFSARKLRVGEGMVEVGTNRVWGRINFRSVRLGQAQFVLTLIEDLTLEKKHLLLIESQKEIMRQAKETYENQLHLQTTELKVMNTRLREEIEERTNAQAALEKSWDGFNNIVEKMSDGIAILDYQGMIHYANRVLARFLGKACESFLGEKLAIPLVPGEYSEMHIIRASGEPGIAEIRTTRTQWNGKASYLVVFRDVTDRKRAQKELLRVQKLESLELIASGLAHDFNNLLTANIANISLAKIRSRRDAPFYDALMRAEKASSKAQELCRQLLTFTKGGPLVKQPTALAPLLKETADVALSASNVKLVSRIAEDLWTAEIEPSQISMVFQNLIINAKQAMTRGGTVVIEAENVVAGAESSIDATQSAKAKYVRVIIKDNGSGISPENLSKIFDPYFTTKSSGSGLGLATSYTVVRKHGGRIEVESRLGVGTSFFVYLPASDRCPEISQISNWPLARGRGSILVLYDDEEERDAAHDLLSRLGYRVEMTDNCDSALEQYRTALESKNPFHAVVIDFAGTRGSETKGTAQKLLAIDSQAKVILCCSVADRHMMLDFKRHGSVAVIAKPHSVVELGEILRKVILKDPPES